MFNSEKYYFKNQNPLPMKTISLNFKTLLLLSFTSLLFIQCSEDEITKNDDSNMNYAALSIEAETFSQLLNDDENQFTGILISIIDGNATIEKVNNDNNTFISTKVDIRPTFSKVIIDHNSKIHLASSLIVPEENLVALPEDLDFAYFNWSDLELIMNNSDKIYLSGASITYKGAFHGEMISSEDSAYPTLKIEGDFKKSIQKENNFARTPMYINGIPCPTAWGN